MKCLAKNIFSFTLSVGFILWVTAAVQALNPVEEPLRDRIIRGIELSMNNRFPESLSLFQELIDEYPEHPAGYFYKGATLQAQMMDAEDYQLKDAFYEMMGRAIQAGESRRKLQPEDPWLFFYEGSAYLYRSFLKIREGKWFSAYKDAGRGAGLLEKAVALDNSCYDAYLGIGSFQYWKSARAHFLLWLPFVSDHREEGIEMIYLAVESGYFSREVGKDQLVWILLDKGDFPRALQLAWENVNEYPHSRFFRWTLAAAAFKSRDWELSDSLYLNLLQEVRQMPVANGFNEVECLVKRAEISREQGRWEEALAGSTAALRISLQPEVRERARNKLRKALEIQQQAQKQLSVSSDQ